jgi:hypothetical protein
MVLESRAEGSESLKRVIIRVYSRPLVVKKRLIPSQLASISRCICLPLRGNAVPLRSV